MFQCVNHLCIYISTLLWIYKYTFVLLLEILDSCYEVVALDIDKKSVCCLLRTLNVKVVR